MAIRAMNPRAQSGPWSLGGMLSFMFFWMLRYRSAGEEFNGSRDKSTWEYRKERRKLLGGDEREGEGEGRGCPGEAEAKGEAGEGH